MKEERKFQVLKIIVEDFIETSEPVGSENLLKKYGLNCSSATIRNIMASLEKEGYIEKQHISSGRVPSSKGYQYYLNHLSTDNSLSSIDMEFQREIQNVLEKRTTTVEDTLKESCKLLSEMTQTAAVVLGPKITDERLISLQLVKINDNQALGILITDSGYVEKKTFVIPNKGEIRIDDISSSVKMLNDRLHGCPLNELEQKSQEIAPIILKMYGNSGDFVINAFLEAFLNFAVKRYEVYGQENLLNTPELAKNTNVIKQTLKALDNPSNIEKRLSHKDDLGNVQVSFTDENKAELAIVEKNIFGKDSIAVIGPRRMDYRKIISILEYIAYMFEKKFNNGGSFNELVPINGTIVDGEKKVQNERKGKKK